MQNSILCGVTFVFYCTRIFKSKIPSGLHPAASLKYLYGPVFWYAESYGVILLFDFSRYFKFKMATRLQLVHSAVYILKHFRNAPSYFCLFLRHGLVEDIFLVMYHVRVQ